MFTLAGSDKLDTLIRSFRAQIAARDLDYRVSAKALYKELLAPAANALRGADRWILSPDGALWDVPFQALMDPQGRHLSRDDLAELHALAVGSSPVAGEAEPAAPGSPRLALLAVANPAVQGVAAIPESEREASAIAALVRPGPDDRAGGRRRQRRAVPRKCGRSARDPYCVACRDGDQPSAGILSPFHAR